MKTAIALSLLSAITVYSASAASIEGCYTTDDSQIPLIYIQKNSVSYKLSTELVSPTTRYNGRTGDPYTTYDGKKEIVSTVFEASASPEATTFTYIPMSRDPDVKVAKGYKVASAVTNDRTAAAKISSKIFVAFNPLNSRPIVEVQAKIQEPRKFNQFLLWSSKRTIETTIAKKLSNSVCERAGL